MWNRLIESNLRESKRVDGSRFEGNRSEGHRFHWLLLVVIVLAVLYVSSFPARLTFYQSAAQSCGTVIAGQTARASVDEAYGCLAQAFRVCQARQLSTQIEHLTWVLRVVSKSQGCALSTWETGQGVDRTYTSGPYICQQLSPEWYGLRVRGCDELGEILLSDGPVGNPPGVSSCGTVRMALSTDPLVDSGQAQAAENCFAQAAATCKPAVLAVEVAPTLVAPAGDTDAQTLQFHQALAVVPYRDACAVVILDMSLPICTLAVPAQADGLHMMCPYERELVIPSGSGMQDAPFTGQRCGALQFRQEAPAVSADDTIASAVKNCFLNAWDRCENAHMEAVQQGAEESVFTVVPSGSTCGLSFRDVGFDPYRYTLIQSQPIPCASVVATAAGTNGLRFIGCAGGADIFIFAARQALDCASAVAPLGIISAVAANCPEHATESHGG